MARSTCARSIRGIEEVQPINVDDVVDVLKEIEVKARGVAGFSAPVAI
jgi:hypothetical protein